MEKEKIKVDEIVSNIAEQGINERFEQWLFLTTYLHFQQLEVENEEICENERNLWRALLNPSYEILKILYPKDYDFGRIIEYFIEDIGFFKITYLSLATLLRIKWIFNNILHVKTSCDISKELLEKMQEKHRDFDSLFEGLIMFSDKIQWNSEDFDVHNGIDNCLKKIEERYQEYVVFFLIGQEGKVHNYFQGEICHYINYGKKLEKLGFQFHLPLVRNILETFIIEKMRESSTNFDIPKSTYYLQKIEERKTSDDYEVVFFTRKEIENLLRQCINDQACGTKRMEIMGRHYHMIYQEDEIVYRYVFGSLFMLSLTIGKYEEALQLMKYSYRWSDLWITTGTMIKSSHNRSHRAEIDIEDILCNDHKMPYQVREGILQLYKKKKKLFKDHPVIDRRSMWKMLPGDNYLWKAPKLLVIDDEKFRCTLHCLKEIYGIAPECMQNSRTHFGALKIFPEELLNDGKYELAKGMNEVIPLLCEIEEDFCDTILEALQYVLVYIYHNTEDIAYLEKHIDFLGDFYERRVKNGTDKETGYYTAYLLVLEMASNHYGVGEESMGKLHQLIKRIRFSDQSNWKLAHCIHYIMWDFVPKVRDENEAVNKAYERYLEIREES